MMIYDLIPKILEAKNQKMGANSGSKLRKVAIILILALVLQQTSSSSIHHHQQKTW